MNLLAYGTLRAPLAMLELPLYVVLPNLYGAHLGMNLAWVGPILLLARLIDALADPLIGAALRPPHFYRWIIWAALPMVVGVTALMLPPEMGQVQLAAWLLAGSILTYLSYSVISISYQSWGAWLSQTDEQRTRLVATREVFGLFGVVVASLLAAISLRHWLVGAFSVALVLGLWALRQTQQVTLGRFHEAISQSSERGSRTTSIRASLKTSLKNQSFRWLLASFLLNGIATAIPATLVLFFLRDVLQVPDALTGRYLLVYFLAAAVGIPLWVGVIKRLGYRKSWLLGMVLAVLGFIWTLALDQHGASAFYLICAITGLALGADLTIPAALLAAVIAKAGHSDQEGSYFGIWNLATKLNLAIAAGTALPLLAWAGYVPSPISNELAGRSAIVTGSSALIWIYAGLPCVLKLSAGLCLLLSPKDSTVDFHHQTQS
jgi:glycoside/pentoside/hexuronide:cation symporter, GPH family